MVVLLLGDCCCCCFYACFCSCYCPRWCRPCLEVAVGGMVGLTAGLPRAPATRAGRGKHVHYRGGRQGRGGRRRWRHEGRVAQSKAKKGRTPWWKKMKGGVGRLERADDEEDESASRRWRRSAGACGCEDVVCWWLGFMWRKGGIERYIEAKQGMSAQPRTHTPTPLPPYTQTTQARGGQGGGAA